jgi:PAS domain S-box-containing protein
MARPTPSKLRTRLVLLVLLAVIPSLALVVLHAAEQRRRSADDAGALAQRIAALAATDQERLVDGSRQLLVTTAQLPEVHGNRATACRTLMADLLRQFPQYANLGVAGADGFVRCQGVTPSKTPVDVRDRKWFQDAVASRSFAVGEYQLDTKARKATLSFGYPAIQNGAIEAVVFAALDLATIEQLAAKVELPPAANVTVFDRSGRILARRPDRQRYVGQVFPEAEIVRAGSSRQVVEARGLDGVKRIYAFEPLKSGATVSVGIAKSAELAQANADLRRNLIGLGVVAALAIVAAWIVGGVLVVRPVRSLVHATDRLRGGDYGARTGVPHVANEIGTLAQAFDEMAETLQQREAERRLSEQEIRNLAAALEQRVAERTIELGEVNRDLSEREGALGEAQAFLEHLVATSPGVIFRLSAADGALAYVSPNIERVLGVPPDEALALPEFWLDRILEEDVARFREEMRWACTAHPAQVEDEFRMMHKDGEPRWIYTVMRAEDDPNGTPETILGFGLDVTRRKVAELELHRAKSEAERATQAKSEFLGRMSHELRTPLTSILGFGQLLDDELLTPKQQRESIRLILRAGEHLLELINEVLDVARIEQGRMTISPEPVHIREVLSDAAALIEPQAAKRKVRVDVGIGCDTFVTADRQRLKQVLLNLLSNAVKYNRDGGSVTVRCFDADDGFTRIEVTDTGPGIQPDALARLFQPFERLDAEGTVEGTGIGLALSKGLVELMNGRIGAASEPGTGSTFWLELPPAVEPKIERAKIAVMAEPAPEQVETKTVLYVEDNPSNISLVRMILEQRPAIDLLTATRGADAIALARAQGDIDLILLDLHLTDMSGIDVATALHADAATQEIPIVIISADATPGHNERLAAAGAREYLTKPLDVRLFLETVDRILSED